MPEAKKREQGFVLVVTLWVMAILALIGGTYAFSTRTEMKIEHWNIKETRSYYAARAGINSAAGLIRLHANDPVMNLTSKWWSDEKIFRDIPFAGHTYSIIRNLSSGSGDYGIDDEESRLNINNATSEMLMGFEGVSNILSEAIVFYISKKRKEKEHKTFQDSFTSKKTEGFQKKKDENITEPIHDLRELLQIEGMSQEILYGLPGNQTQGIAEELTCYSSGKVNINTARPRVLRAIGFSEEEVKTILSLRQPGWIGFSSVDELLKKFTFKHKQRRDRISKITEVKSRNFRLKCRAVSPDWRQATLLTARLSLYKKNMKFTLWQVRTIEYEK